MKYTLFGESHGSMIGIVLEKVPAGHCLDMEQIAFEMARRAPGTSPLSTARKEADAVQLVSGVFEGKTTGAPLCATIANSDTRSKDYMQTRWLARPGHADYTAHCRYDGHNDPRGGGHFSGRLTAPLVFAGAVAKQLLKQHNINVAAHIRELAGITDSPLDKAAPDMSSLCAVADKAFPVLDDTQGAAMQAAILKARGEGDAVGGIVECVVCGMPAGYGGPDIYDTLEGRLAQHLFAVPAVKGVEFGSGFHLARMRASEANDPWLQSNTQHPTSPTNHNGGINGGISNGLPLVLAVAIKPTPSIAKEQQTVDMRTGEAATLHIKGRHDPCIVQRALPVIEAVTALALTELFF